MKMVKKKKTKKEEVLKELRDPMFWVYIVSMVLLVVLLYKVPLKSIKIFAFFALPTMQVIYNLKGKFLGRELFHSLVRWVIVAILLLFAIAYTATVSKEIQIAAITLIFAIGVIFLSATIANLSGLWASRRSKQLWKIILSYLSLAFTSIALFAYLYAVFGGVVGSTGSSLGGAWEYMYFSSSIFYSNISGGTPQGFSRILVQLEFAYSLVIHAILLATVINSFPRK